MSVCSVSAAKVSLVMWYLTTHSVCCVNSEYKRTYYTLYSLSVTVHTKDPSCVSPHITSLVSLCQIESVGVSPHKNNQYWLLLFCSVDEPLR